MDMFVVEGGVPLRGTVAASGAKNAALPILAAGIAAGGSSLIRHVPRLVDVQTLISLLRSLGLSAEWVDDDEIRLQVNSEENCTAEYDLVRKMRASVCVLGPLLARRGRACVSLPGGCNIGERPIDIHLRGLTALGADIRVERGYVIATAGRLIGNTINLSGPHGSTVTGTCNVMVAAALARGKSVLHAAACEPEVVDLGDYLNAMGARISGLGTPTIEIEGVSELRGTEHTLIPDRIEAATLMIASGISRGEVRIENICMDHLGSVLQKLREIGLTIESSGGSVLATGGGTYSPTNCTALPYPGVPTDLQAQLMAWLANVPGESRIVDDVFPDRFMHLSELVRMGADIRRESFGAMIRGVERLQGACVMASDLRASAALVLAALAGEGESVIRRIYHLDRGYDGLEKKLASLGARIRRVKDSPEELPETLQPHFGALEVRGALEVKQDEKRILRLDPAHPIHESHQPGVDVPERAVPQTPINQNRA